MVSGSFKIPIDEFIQANSGKSSFLEKVKKNYLQNKVIKVCNNEQMNGLYKVVNFFFKFYYFGNQPNWRDCAILLGIMLIRDNNSDNVETAGYMYKKNVSAEALFLNNFGFLQIINEDDLNLNNTFITFSREMDSGLYDDNRLSNEISNKLTTNKYIFKVNINEHKNVSSFNCYKKRYLGSQSIYYRNLNINSMYSLDNNKKKYIVIIKYINHELIENDVIKIEKEYGGANYMDHIIKNFIYGKSFNVHLLKVNLIKNDKMNVFGNNELYDFIFVDNESVMYPICQNYFYIDLTDVYDEIVCENIFNGNECYGIKYDDSNNEFINYINNPSISGLGDIIVKNENLKLLFSEKFSMDKILGFDKVDTFDYLVKRCTIDEKDATIVNCINHNLISGDIIEFNGFNKDDNNVTKYDVTYISQNRFKIHPIDNIVGSSLMLDSKYLFFNYSPIKLMFQEIKVEPKSQIQYLDDEQIMFNMTNNALTKFKIFLSDTDNIFQCNIYGDNCFNLCEIKKQPVNGVSDSYFMIISYLDNKIVKGFFSVDDKILVLSKKKIIRIHYYNHNFETGQNEIYLGGYLPLNGSYVVIKKNKDFFYIISRFKCDNLIFKKEKYNPLDIFITSDYNGFYTQLKNTDFFGNTKCDINFESYPYLLCCSKKIGGNIKNIYFNYEMNEVSNLFAKFNMPEKLSRDTRMVYDRQVLAAKTFEITPLPSLSVIDFQFYYPNGVPFDFQQVDHSMVLLIREYYDSDILPNEV
jgi:hypothetical protein